MIAQLQIQPMTPQEYIEWEEQQPIKHEYMNGEIYAMTGVYGSFNQFRDR